MLEGNITMKKLNLLILFIIILTFSVNIKALELNSEYAILYNLNDNEVVYSKNENKKISVASLTKIMTSVIAIEKLEDLDKKVMVPYGTNYGLKEQNAATVGFIEGSYVTYNDLLYGALLPSGADATRALALIISGSETDFAQLMNEKAKKIGMTNTHFVNSSGLDVENHYSTVKDILTLLKYALENEKFKKIYESKDYITSNKKIYMESTIKKYEKQTKTNLSFIKGSKTGFTYGAGLCLASLIDVDGNNFLSITSGAKVDGNPYHIMDAKEIYNYLKANYSYKEILKPNQLILTLKPKYSKETEVKFYTDKTKTKFINNSEEVKLDYIYNGKEILFGNETKNTHLGTIDIVYKNEVIDTIEIKLENDLTFDYLKYLKQYIYLIPIFLIISLISIITIIKTVKH